MYRSEPLTETTRATLLMLDYAPHVTKLLCRVLYRGKATNGGVPLA